MNFNEEGSNDDVKQPNSINHPENLVEVRTPMNWRKIGLIVSGVLVWGALGGLLLFLFISPKLSSQPAKPTLPPSATAMVSPSSSSQTSQTQQDKPVPTLPPLLAKAEFPSQQTTYPTSWPKDLQFPEQLILVDTSSGSLPNSNYKGWGAKFWYQGRPIQAADFLSSFLTAKGWKVNRENLDSGGVLLDIDRDAKASVGSFILDPEPGNPGLTRILMTVRL